MARIKGRDTKPELRLRSALHRIGLRFRVCRKDLPGKSDVVFPGHRLAVRVRGCSWRQHDGCRDGRLPVSNLDYWRPKQEGNVRRDTEKDEVLRALGWHVLVVWEHELKMDGGVLKQAKAVQSQLATLSAV